MLMTVARALLPVFFVIALGYWAGKAHLIDNQNVSSLNSLVMRFALPISLFTSVAATSRAAIARNWTLAVMLAVVMLIVFVIAELLERRVYRLKPADAAVQALTVALPNYASVGLPLFAAVYGPGGDLAVAVAIAIGSITVSPLTLALLENAQHSGDDGGSAARRFGGALERSVRKPIFVGPVLGLIWSLVGLPMPGLLSVTFKEIGGIAAGAALFLTGLIVSAQKVRISAHVLVSTVVTAVVKPAIGVLLVWAFHVPQPYASQSLLLLTIPSGFFGILFGLDAKSRPAVAGSTLFVSSVVSIATLWAAIALFT